MSKGGSLLSRLVGKCPVVDVCLGGAEVTCLLDTGAQVSTLTESFYRENLSDLSSLEDVSQFIKISAANGLEIPYLGYVELDMQALGRTFPRMGFLIVKDPKNTPIAQRKKEVPGVIGCNVLNLMHTKLYSDLGQSYMSTISTCFQEDKWVKVLTLLNSMTVTSPAEVDEIFSLEAYITLQSLVNV